VYVIANGSIFLDAKLGIFTVRVTVEQTLVQLFPKLSCSCPAAGGCYHIAAAKQAIDMRDDVQRRKLNLTQLHKNKRNRPDKTSERKRLRTADVDVIAAPDADPSVASATTGHVDDDVEPDDSDDAVIIRDDICHACDSANPPARKNRKVHQIDRSVHDGIMSYALVFATLLPSTPVICASEHCPRLLTVV